MKAKYYKKGFTFAEIIIAIAVLSFVLLTILGIFGAAASSAKKGENHLVAVSLAQQMMEIYKNDLELDFDQHGDVLPISATNTTVLNNVTFETDIVIGQVIGPDPANPSISKAYSTDRIREIKISVKWKEHAGGEKDFTIKTYVSNK